MIKQIFFLSVCLIIISCSDKAVMRRRIRNTINASGFISDANKMYNATKSELIIYDIKPKDVIAEIGFGTGWLTGFVLFYYDSLTYYANDIDQASLKAIEPITKKYLGLRQTPNTNIFIVIEGTTTKTNLPAKTFDKIIVRETLHHFDNPNEMLQDIKSLLKSDGRVFVYEPNVEKTFFSKECGSNNYSKADLLKLFYDNDFVVLKEYDLTDSPGNIPSWYVNSWGKARPKKVFVLTNKL